MKIKVLPLLFCITAGTAAFSQVGINTTVPQGIFHIDAAKDNNAATAPTTAQQKDDFTVTPTGEVGIGTTTPRGVLDLNNNGTNTRGFVLPTTANTATIVNPQGGAIAEGTIIYDSSSKCIRFYTGTGWSNCAQIAGGIATIDCAGATNSGTLYGGSPAVAVSSSLNYSGGSGGSHTGQSVASTGVTGLLATLSIGNFATGAGTLVYNITGTPSGAGTASFAINIGGQTCTLTRAVSISLCVLQSGPLTTDTKAFMCFNLGADNSLDPTVPVQGINGNYYQWGRKVLVADAYTNAAAIVSWNTTYAPANAWLDASKTANDPCPAGFRVPPSSLWNLIFTYNNRSTTGTFTNSFTNFGAAVNYGTVANPKILTLPMAGSRDFNDGSYGGQRGTNGCYWSSTAYSTYAGYYATLSNGSSSITNNYSSSGYSVRCVLE